MIIRTSNEHDRNKHDHRKNRNRRGGPELRNVSQETQWQNDPKAHRHEDQVFIEKSLIGQVRDYARDLFAKYDVIHAAGQEAHKKVDATQEVERKRAKSSSAELAVGRDAEAARLFDLFGGEHH